MNFFFFSGKVFIFLDMIVRIKNAITVKKQEVFIKKSNLVFNVVQILQSEGFIDSFEQIDKNYILIYLKYKGLKQKSYITDLKRVSKSGFRVYANYKSIPKILDGVGVSVCAERLYNI